MSWKHVILVAARNCLLSGQFSAGTHCYPTAYICTWFFPIGRILTRLSHLSGNNMGWYTALAWCMVLFATLATFKLTASCAEHLLIKVANRKARNDD